jgi:hypothetical protein
LAALAISEKAAGADILRRENSKRWEMEEERVVLWRDEAKEREEDLR